MLCRSGCMHALLTCLLVRQHLHAEDGPKWCEALVEEQLVCVEGQVLQGGDARNTRGTLSWRGGWVMPQRIALAVATPGARSQSSPSERLPCAYPVVEGTRQNHNG